MKIFFTIILASLIFVSANTPVFARSSRSYSSRSYSIPTYKAPRINSNPRYIAPRSQIYVPKRVPVKPYFKSNGTFVPGYNRAPAGALKPYYNPFYVKPFKY